MAAPVRTSDGVSPPLERRGARVLFYPVWLGNAYIRLLYSHLADLGISAEPGGRLDFTSVWGSRSHVDVLHFHWQQHFYTYRGRQTRLVRLHAWKMLMGFGLRLMFARALGYRIVWTIHQVHPHESVGRRLDHAAARLLAVLSNALIVHDRATALAATRQLGGRAARKVELIPHGSYIGAYPAGRPRDAVRAELGIPSSAFVFLCFGAIRPYKEVGFLLDAFGALNLEDVVLVVAGKPIDQAAARGAVQGAASDRRLRLRLGYVPDREVAELFEACDAVVLPRGDDGTSGALILALSMGRPAIAARRSAYVELLGAGDCGWLFEPGDVGSLVGALEEAARHPALARVKGVAALEVARSLRWPELAARMARVIVGREAVPMVTPTRACTERRSLTSS